MVVSDDESLQITGIQNFYEKVTVSAKTKGQVISYADLTVRRCGVETI